MDGFRSSLLALAALLPACGGGSEAYNPPVAMYKSFGSVQCTGGGLTLPALERQLIDAGVRVISAKCGLDGNVYAAVCGGPDGRIGIVEIEQQQSQLAATIGFAPLSTLPAATQVPCR